MCVTRSLLIFLRARETKGIAASSRNELGLLRPLSPPQWTKEMVKELCDFLETPEIYKARRACDGGGSRAPHAHLSRSLWTRALFLFQNLQEQEVVPDEGECMIGRIEKENLWEARRIAFEARFCT